MVTKYQIVKTNIGIILMLAVLALGFISVYAADIDNTPTTQVEVGNAAPTVANVTLNAANDMNLTPNATTAFSIAYQITDNNGCDDIDSSTNGTTTVYRSGVSASCAVEWPTTSNLNCYRHFAVAFNNASSSRSTSTCSGGSTINVTDTVEIYYFAQATDASSSFDAQNWAATVFARDLSGATGTAASAAVELNTLLAIRVTTSSIFYNSGQAMSASSTTGTINELATSTNVGNSSTTYSLRVSATLTDAPNSIATSNQRWATSSFDYETENPGGNGPVSTQLTESDVNVADHIEQPATTTAGTAGRLSYWGLRVPAGTTNGTYTGVNIWTGVFQP